MRSLKAAQGLVTALLGSPHSMKPGRFDSIVWTHLLEDVIYTRRARLASFEPCIPADLLAVQLCRYLSRWFGLLDLSSLLPRFL